MSSGLFYHRQGCRIAKGAGVGLFKKKTTPALWASAIALGHLTAAQFDQWVRPENMVGIKIKAGKKKK